MTFYFCVGKCSSFGFQMTPDLIRVSLGWIVIAIVRGHLEWAVIDLEYLLQQAYQQNEMYRQVIVQNFEITPEDPNGGDLIQ